MKTFVGFLTLLSLLVAGCTIVIMAPRNFHFDTEFSQEIKSREATKVNRSSAEPDEKDTKEAKDRPFLAPTYKE